jgi:hypothetical protein
MPFSVRYRGEGVPASRQSRNEESVAEVAVSGVATLR